MFPVFVPVFKKNESWPLMFDKIISLATVYRTLPAERVTNFFNFPSCCAELLPIYFVQSQCDRE